MTHIALYGNVAIVRGECKACQRTAFIIDGRFACCDAKAEAVPKKYKRESEPEGRRRLPRVKDRVAQLELQGNKCFYCDRMLESFVYRRGRPIRLRLNWDHQVPYSYSQNNAAHNFVASCHICNGIKTNKCFASVEDARVAIQLRWLEKGYTSDPPIGDED